MEKEKVTEEGLKNVLTSLFDGLKADEPRESQDFFASRMAAFNAMWKFIEGTYDETDYCP